MRRYKEILFGCGLGFVMWIVDAAMHVQLAAAVHSSSGFVEELLQPGVTQLFFRSVFLFIATAFGWSLWRSNWRERELRALEDAVIAFHRQLDSPAMRIVNHIRMLQGRPSIMLDDVAKAVAESIGDDARTIDRLAQSYMRFSEQVIAGRNHEAIETLRAIETLTNSNQPAATSTQRSSSSPS